MDDFHKIAHSSVDWSPVKARGVEITIFTDHVTDVDRMADRLKEFDAIMVIRERSRISRALIEKLPKLKLICNSGMGNRSIDFAAAKDRGITVCGTDGGGMPTAELAWGLIIGLSRNILAEDRSLRDGGWQQSPPGVALGGKTLGVLGLGKLGAQVAKIGLAMNMKVMAWSQNLTEERCRTVGVTKAASKDELLSSSDVVSIHLVLSDRTRGLIGRREFGLMKKTAYLVNTSRGPIIDEDALIEAMNGGAIAGVGLDVYAVEPLPRDHPIRRLPRSIITPHLGYATQENYRDYFTKTIENILGYLEGKPKREITGEH